MTQPDDPKAVIPSPGETPPEDAAPTPAPVTREDFDAFASGLRDGMFSTMRKMFGDLSKEIRPPAPPEPAQKSNGTPTADPALAARMDAFELDKQFDRAVSGMNLRGRRREILRREFTDSKPEDPHQWARDMVKELGFGAEEKPPATPQEPSTPGSAPAPQRHGVTPSRVWEWSEADLQADMDAKAPNPGNPYDIANKNYYKELEKRARAEAANIVFTFGNEGRK